MEHLWSALESSANDTYGYDVAWSDISAAVEHGQADSAACPKLPPRAGSAWTCSSIA
jgi:hypothetical protein